MRALAVIASGLLALTGIAACIDGVTPDCSNAAICAPIEGDPPAGSTDAAPETSAPPVPAPDTGAPNTPDASPPADASPVDAADGG